MEESNEMPSNMMFLDIASGSQQLPKTEDAEIPLLNNVEHKNGTTSPLEALLTVQERRHRCPECQRFTAETEEKLLRHIRKMHRGENPFQCYMCDYSTYNKVLFEEHVRIHQGIKPYKCSQCPYKSVSKKNTKKHEQIHRPDNPCRCSKCGFIARHIRSLRVHELSHVGANEATFDCQMCKDSFRNITAYKNHRKSRKRCAECNEMFCRKLYPEHQLEVHGVLHQKQEKKSSSKKYIFTCAICEWKGNSRPRILLHLIHHPDQEVDESIDTFILKELGIMKK